MRPLTIPPAAERDDDSVQMLSAWIAERGLHCSLNIGMWADAGINEPETWGKLLADLTRHIGNALKEHSGLDADACVNAVTRAYLEELGAPTTQAKGQFQKRHH